MDQETKNRFLRRKEKTRSQLKEACKQLLLEKGYRALTIDNIVERADVGRGTFYLHFKDKEEVLWSIVRDGIDTLGVELNRKYQRDHPLDLSYYGYLELFEFINRDRPFFKALMMEEGKEILTNRLQEDIAVEVVNEITQMGAFPDLPSLPPEFLAQFITGALAKLMEWWFHMENPYEPARMAAMVFTMIHRRNPPEGEKV